MAYIESGFLLSYSICQSSFADLCFATYFNLFLFWKFSTLSVIGGGQTLMWNFPHFFFDGFPKLGYNCEHGASNSKGPWKEGSQKKLHWIFSQWNLYNKKIWIFFIFFRVMVINMQLKFLLHWARQFSKKPLGKAWFITQIFLWLG